MNALAPINAKPLRAFVASEATGPLMMLFAAYPEPYSDKRAELADEMQEAKLKAYIAGLDGLPEWAVEHAVREFIQGKVERPARKRGVLPTVEELAAIARGEVAKEATRQRADAVVREQVAERAKSSSFTPAHRARMGMKLAILSAGFARRQCERVKEANDRGLEDMVALAQEWDVPVPESVWQELSRGQRTVV